MIGFLNRFLVVALCLVRPGLSVVRYGVGGNEDLAAAQTVAFVPQVATLA